MLAEITGIKDRELELKIHEEDISIMYIVQHELLKDKNTEFAGVVLKHPLVRDYVLRIITKKKNQIEALNDAISSAAEYSKEVTTLLKNAMKK